MASGNLYIGLDLGGTFLKYALGNGNGKILSKGRKPSKADESQDEVFNVIYSVIDELIDYAEEKGDRVVAIGMGSPGAIDFDKCRLIGSTPNIKNWTDADIRGHIEGRYGIPVWADNDANVMAFAEARQGAAKGHQDVICVTLGTGIGGGIIIDGHIYRGPNYAGSEIGHLMIVHNGLKCNCGGRGCMEQYASAPAMMREYKQQLELSKKPVPENISPEIIFKNARAGEVEAIRALDIIIDYLGTGFASLVNIFNPEVVVFGGGVGDAGQDFIDKIKKAIEEKAMKPALKGLKVMHAKLGNDAGFVGAINLAAEMYEKMSMF